MLCQAVGKGLPYVVSHGLAVDLLKRILGVPSKAPSRPGTGTADASSQLSTGPRSILFCYGIFNSATAVTEAVQAGLPIQAFAQLIDDSLDPNVATPRGRAEAAAGGLIGNTGQTP